MTESLAQLVTDEVIKSGIYRKIIAECARGQSQLVIDCGDTKFQIDQDSIVVIPANYESIPSE